MDKVKSNGQIFGGAADFYEIINEMDRALETYCGTTNSKKGMLLIYGSSLNSTVRVEMYANYSNRKNRDGRYNLIDFVIRLIDDENIIVETNTITDAMELIAENINDEAETFNDGNDHDNDTADELDDMFEYAAEVHDEIENFCDEISMAYGDVEYEAHLQNPDYDYIKERINDLYDRLWDVANELGWCLHRCDERTGCNIWWDDFCPTEYFKDLKIAAGYDCTVTEFIDFFDNDPDQIMDDILAALADGVDDYDAFRNFINDETDFSIAA